ncbi:hypothetical protein M404DRAFT_194327 [Pisolithus tinctorius Marx 270]|uniref:Uncharacterized protein n=1 Tax=Pisolithus tinctorius Marx 270 TaxID=870435 RepID=A0A0C3PYX2_PISTI|nr:hypothetical protein M404DRAFT_194327 [Pisolithus tinctorius Marx 270]
MGYKGVDCKYLARSPGPKGDTQEARGERLCEERGDSDDTINTKCCYCMITLFRPQRNGQT